MQADPWLRLSLWLLLCLLHLCGMMSACILLQLLVHALPALEAHEACLSDQLSKLHDAFCAKGNEASFARSVAGARAATPGQNGHPTLTPPVLASSSLPNTQLNPAISCTVYTSSSQQKAHSRRLQLPDSPPPEPRMQAQASNYFVEINEQPLEINKYVDAVSDPSAGAISTFSGTTRNNFQGKAVLKLEYEAYVPMALKKLQVGPGRAQALLGPLPRDLRSWM